MKRIALAAILALVGCSTSESNSAALSGNEADAAPAAEANTVNAADTATPAVPAGALAALRAELGADLEANAASAVADLDGDGRAEVIAYVTGPLVCGSGGCNSYVLTPDGEGWRIVMNASVTQLPIRLLPERSQGWQDLMVSVGGGGREAGQARMRFDGSRYPGNPTVAPAEPMTAPAGTVLIAEDDPARPVP